MPRKPVKQRLPDIESHTSNRLIAIGKIVRAHGVRGEVHVAPLSNIPGRLKSVKKVHLDIPDGQCFMRTVEKARGAGDTVIMKFDGIETRDSADELRGAYVSIAESSLPKLDDGIYYSHELIGMTVFDTDGINIGTIIRIESYPASDVLVVEKDTVILQIPAVRDFVLSIDQAEKKIIVRPPENMIGKTGDSE